MRTWRDGAEATYEVRRGNPFDISLPGSADGVLGHGTEIRATEPGTVALTPDEAREEIGTKFLSDPQFKVIVDGTPVTFRDVPAHRMKELTVPVPPYGNAEVIVIDTIRADRTTQHHGIAWWVNDRLVGTPSWTGFHHERILDGRTPRPSGSSSS